MNEILLKAVNLSGGQLALARKIGVSQGHLWCWLHRDKKVPAERCADIEQATGGAVTCADLRPDVFRRSAATPSTPPADEARP